MDTKNLKVGDIIWGKRYKDKEERERIPVGHREGPYIIIEKRKNRIYGLECTTKSWTGWKMLKLKIKELGKNNYVFLGKIFNINKSNYLYKIGKINNTELNLIKKQLYIIQKTNYRNKIKKVIIDKEEIKLSKGDIITYNKEKIY